MRSVHGTNELYDSVARDCADLVIRRYSSSFGMASRLLREPVRGHVRNVYALVRIADEIVDNPDAGLGSTERSAMLDALLADLGLGRADERERRHALSDWLANHEPSKRLVRSFERRGYGDLISG